MELGRQMLLVILHVVGLAMIMSFSFNCAVAQQDTDILPQSDVQPLLSDMVGQGFTVAAAVVQSVQSLIPIRSTLLIPTNDAIAGITANLSQVDVINTLQYHVLNFPTSFEAMSRKPVGTEMPTMLEGAAITVTSNSPGNFTLNKVNVTNPDVCSSTRFIACHGIDRVLAYNTSLAAAPAPSQSQQASPSEGETPGTRTANPSNRKSNTTSGVPLRHSFTGGAVLVEMLAFSWWLM